MKMNEENTMSVSDLIGEVRKLIPIFQANIAEAKRLIESIDSSWEFIHAQIDPLREKVDSILTPQEKAELSKFTDPAGLGIELSNALSALDILEEEMRFEMP